MWIGVVICASISLSDRDTIRLFTSSFSEELLTVLANGKI